MVQEYGVRIATDADLASIIALRAAWTMEDEAPNGSSDVGPLVDREYADAFRAWWNLERDQRVTWLASLDARDVGMLNLVVFSRMPKPGRLASYWGYIANVFLIEGHRDKGVGRRLLDEAIGYADVHDFARLVLTPSERAVRFYQRAGFVTADTLMVRTR